MDDIRFIVNQSAELRWAGPAVRPTIWLAQEKRSFVLSPVLARLVFALTNPLSIPELEELLQQWGGSKEEASNLIQDAVDTSIIVREDTSDLYSGWRDAGWRHAAIFHASTMDAAHVDQGQEDGQIAKSQLLERYLSEENPPDMYKTLREVTQVVLPPPSPIDTDLFKCLLSRRTHRKFSEQALTLGEISSLLSAAMQPAVLARDLVAEYARNDPVIFTLSSYMPFEIYVAANNVDGLVSGIYHYQPKAGGVLFLIREGRYADDLSSIAIGQGIEGASIGIFITCVFDRYSWRYRESRALRNIYIECGSLAQRIILAATGLGMRTFLTPALRDSSADLLLGLEYWRETVMYLIAAGR